MVAIAHPQPHTPRLRTGGGDAARPGLAPEAAVRARPARLPDSTYRRRQAVAAGLVAVLVLAIGVALDALGGGPLPISERSGQGQPAELYVVQPGDTFWTLARRLRPGEDPRPLVDRLIAAHGGSVLHVGERIWLPPP